MNGLRASMRSIPIASMGAAGIKLERRTPSGDFLLFTSGADVLPGEQLRVSLVGIGVTGYIPFTDDPHFVLTGGDEQIYGDWRASRNPVGTAWIDFVAPEESQEYVVLADWPGLFRRESTSIGFFVTESAPPVPEKIDALSFIDSTREKASEAAREAGRAAGGVFKDVGIGLLPLAAIAVVGLVVFTRVTRR